MGQRWRSRNAPGVAALVEAKAAWWENLKGNPALDSIPIHPYRILKAERELLPEDAIAVTDAGWDKSGLAQQHSGVNVGSDFAEAASAFGVAAPPHCEE